MCPPQGCSVLPAVLWGSVPDCECGGGRQTLISLLNCRQCKGGCLQMKR